MAAAPQSGSDGTQAPAGESPGGALRALAAAGRGSALPARSLGEPRGGASAALRPRRARAAGAAGGDDEGRPEVSGAAPRGFLRLCAAAAAEGLPAGRLLRARVSIHRQRLAMPLCTRAALGRNAGESPAATVAGCVSPPSRRAQLGAPATRCGGRGRAARRGAAPARSKACQWGLSRSRQLRSGRRETAARSARGARATSPEPRRRAKAPRRAAARQRPSRSLPVPTQGLGTYQATRARDGDARRLLDGRTTRVAAARSESGGEKL